jgi:DNA-directed RNA polymerase specialized sigma24 family protein
MRRRDRGTAGWLYGIAQHKLADFFRRGTTDDRMCRRLGLALPRTLDEEDRAMIELLSRDTAASLVDSLPADQRDAVRAHVLEDAAYAEIAADGDVTEATVRKRVSRGLGTLRRKVGAR